MHCYEYCMQVNKGVNIRRHTVTEHFLLFLLTFKISVHNATKTTTRIKQKTSLLANELFLRQMTFYIKHTLYLESVT